MFCLIAGIGLLILDRCCWSNCRRSLLVQDALQSFLEGPAIRQLKEAISSDEETLSARLLKNAKSFLTELLVAKNQGSRYVSIEACTDA